MTTLSEEVLNIPSWYFMGAFDLWQYTFSEEFKNELPETQTKMLEHLHRMEGVRPSDINMKVRFE